MLRAQGVQVRRWAWRIVGALAGGGLYVAGGAVHGSGPGVWLTTLSALVGAAVAERPRSLPAVVVGAVICAGLFAPEGYDSIVGDAVVGAIIGLGVYGKRRWTLDGADSIPKQVLVRVFDQLVPLADLLWLISLIALLMFPALGAAVYGAEIGEEVGAILGGAVGSLAGVVAGAGATILTWSRGRELIERLLTWLCGGPGAYFRDPADYADERDQPWLTPRWMDRQAWLTACGAASGGLLGLTLVSPGWPLAAVPWWAVTAAGMSLGAMAGGLTWAPPVRRRWPALPLVLVGGVAALPAALAAWNALLSW